MYYLYTTIRGAEGYQFIGSFNTYEGAREAGTAYKPMIISSKELEWHK